MMADHMPFRCIRRRLVPKVPRRDQELEQDCTLLHRVGYPDGMAVVMVPILEDGETIPHYHPDVAAIAFRYVSRSRISNAEAADDVEIQGHVSLDIVPRKFSLGNETDTLDTNSRLFKTCKVLLTTVSKHGLGLHNGYVKRVQHDTVIARERYQDLYQEMKEKYKYLKEEWMESTDPTKNVFEDIGIATFLILLWEDTYSPAANNGAPVRGGPPGGFVDMGCGAGLLVHILLSEGYEGIGIDTRARKSWNFYPERTRQCLLARTLSPLDPDFPCLEVFKPGCFLIGNHADELSPWLPIISSLVENTAYMSIPCCSWALDTRFYRNDPSLYPPLDTSLTEAEIQLEKRFSHTRTSVYHAYLCWLAALSIECGFKLELEALRVPTTRNWAIIGRYRDKHIFGREKAREIVSSIVARGLFKAREGASAHA
ncbi:tRNA(Ser) Um(44) 2'-O-methyltransferase [Serendipita sp. 399]|nr:tRNA(Ser) Um(44) 2'-O-methyltransferase [Serendipita sp. 399]